MRVVGIVVVQLRALIHTVSAEHGSRQFVVVRNLPVPGKESRRRKVVHDARVALLAVLIAPVRIVVPVVSHPIHLVGTCTLGCTLRRVTPCSERERMSAVAKHLLHTEEVRQGVIECSLYVSLVSPAVCNVSGKSPSAVAQSGVEGVHAAQGIAAVSTGQCDAVSCRH